MKGKASRALDAIGQHGACNEEQQEYDEEPGAGVELADEIRKFHTTTRILRQREGMRRGMREKKG